MLLDGMHVGTSVDINLKASTLKITLPNLVREATSSVPAPLLGATCWTHEKLAQDGGADYTPGQRGTRKTRFRTPLL